MPPSDKQDRDGLLGAYEQCFLEKRHYDNLSWTIGAGLAVIVAAIISAILHLPPTSIGPRLSLALFAVFLIVLWDLIYRRNGFWGEVANEKARDIEKTLGFDGIAHALMRATLDGKVTLKNTDLDKKPYADRPPVDAASPSHAMHSGIRWILMCCVVLVLFIAIFQISVPSS